MVKKNKELDEQYKYFARKISNQIADIGACFGVLLSMACFCIAMIGYYFVPIEKESDRFLSFNLFEDLFNGIYATIEFITTGLGDYLMNLPEFVLWSFIGIIVGIVLAFVFLLLFWEELEKEEKKSDSEIWNEKSKKKVVEELKKKERPDGMHIYKWNVKVVCHSVLSEATMDPLVEKIEELFGDWGLIPEVTHEELTNEVME